MQEKMKKIAALFCWLSLLAGGVGLSCQVPVFRFALERWPADRFQLLVASRGPLEEGLAKEVASLRRAIEADANEINVDLQQVDVDQLSEAERISHPALDHLGEGPGLILMPPASWKTEDPVWVGEATTESLMRLLDSPLRQRCGDALVKGASAVWVLVECGDAEKDRQARELLEAGVKKAAETLELPEGIIRREDLNKDYSNIDPDNILRSDVPLHISFATESVSRDDPAEDIFLTMLVEPEALELNEPLIVPVFGRGRTFGGLAASQSSVERIVGASEYLCGACSCQVKEGNPGYDLLIRRNWDAILEIEEITPDSEIIQAALDVVTFEPREETNLAEGEEPPAGRSATLLWIAIGGVGLMAGLGYLRFRNSAAA